MLKTRIKYLGGLPYNKRDFDTNMTTAEYGMYYKCNVIMERFINNSTKPFVRESDSHLAGFFNATIKGIQVIVSLNQVEEKYKALFAGVVYSVFVGNSLVLNL
ncbi:hypothetical protein B5X24_HaOG212864 [Helicoverpa armigera]|uniref:Uncharacterized protein n=1 Tax=Helicoverpa armigera TaxID=29058 RepID=A0A2W1BFU0_HELAM|nr:hypothetical protein B5X24_HaOG212864 [Helicoverpa armigera]